MRAIIQRVSRASVEVQGAVLASIDKGLLVYVGVGRGDGPQDVEYLAGKIRYLRIFQDADGKMNLDVQQAGGGVLIVSNFTLYADVQQGRRPAFVAAAPPEEAERLYEQLAAQLRRLEAPVQTGCFGAMMSITAVNDGPVNVILDSPRAA